jgi:hypothetical protein
MAPKMAPIVQTLGIQLNWQSTARDIQCYSSCASSNLVGFANGEDSFSFGHAKIALKCAYSFHVPDSITFPNTCWFHDEFYFAVPVFLMSHINTPRRLKGGIKIQPNLTSIYRGQCDIYR